MVRYKSFMSFVIGLLLLIASQNLGADSKLFNLSNIDSKVTKIEYKIGDGLWEEVNINSRQIEIPKSSNKDNNLFLKLYTKEAKLGEQFVYYFDEKLNTWVYIEPTSGASDTGVEITLSPYATFMFTGQRLNHMYSFPFGLGFDLLLSFPFNKDLVFKFDIEAQYANSNNIWAKSFMIYGGNMGLGYKFQLGETFLLTPTVSYGLFFHHFFECLQEEPIYFSHIVAMNLQTSYKISSNLNIFFSPNVKFMIDRTRSGFLYSLRSGVGLVL
jgi:hypothetical protein